LPFDAATLTIVRPAAWVTGWEVDWMRQFLKGAMAGGVGAAVVMVATAAVAGTGIGGVFNLGKSNTVNAMTSLTGSTSGAQLGITNSGAGPALSLSVASGKPPLKVNSSAKVGNLNASLLYGLPSNEFVQGGGQVRGFFLHLTPDVFDQELLVIPGFGKLRANCEGSEAFLDYLNGSHDIDVWKSGDDQFGTFLAEAHIAAGKVSGIDSLKNLGNGGVIGQARLILHYTTTSGFFVIQHVATVDAGLVEPDGTQCSFVASTVAGVIGRFAP
jgi:hypothetical protein